MALEATHIRFALDLKDEYNVQDIEKYIAGSIYPDSRYVSGIHRDLTHNEDILSPDFAKDDFRKGWQAHQLCDVSQKEMRKKYLKDLSPTGFTEVLGLDWVISTATKIIQDMNDLKKFDIQNNLKYLEYAHNPNGENIEDVKIYNKIMIDLYKDKKETTVEDNYKMWLALGGESEQVEKVKEKTYEFLQDTDLVKRIENIYEKMIASYKNHICINRN